jgi:hypothetical protein
VELVEEGARLGCICVSVSYDKLDEFVHVGAVYEEQVLMRADYVLQCARLNLPVPEFQGFLTFIPAYNNVFIYIYIYNSLQSGRQRMEDQDRPKKKAICF